MSTYSIKDLERLTGIKAHTIRIWEKRYAIVDPSRTDSNIRWYNDEDLKKLLNVSILNRYGYKISRIASLSRKQINDKIMEVVKPESDYLSQIESLIVSMIELNEERLERILNQSILKIGFEETLFYVVYPFFDKMGLLWQTGTINPAQEHFVSNLIRMKLCVAIDSLPPITNPDAKKILLFLPSWELHEIGLLTYYYIARKAGLKVFYLGQNVPYHDLVSVGKTVNPDIIGTYFVSAVSILDMQNYLKALNTDFPNQHVLVSGIQAANIDFELSDHTKLMSSAKDFKSFIKTVV
ncbi:MAG: MerR family transcriptional regulator [Bacteroidales bacterium]|jgi:DNA-binding transcriptional MerR regulator|nr:MerR family transcriptional regulator [Bacteroidales bacterium]